MVKLWTDNLMGALRVGSIPGTGDFSFCFVLFFYDDNVGATRSGTGKREA